jgi:hypothetical protein
MYDISHHQNDTQSLCKSLLLFFVFLFLFVLGFFFSILANIYLYFETGNFPAHERNNFIFHVIYISAILSRFINADIEYC